MERAIIQIGSFQYRVKPGDRIKVEKLEDTKEDLIFPVLAYFEDDKVIYGQPYVENVKCKAKIVGHGKHKKVIIFKHIPKKHHDKKIGHRQPYTEIEILGFIKE